MIFDIVDSIIESFQTLAEPIQKLGNLIHHLYDNVASLVYFANFSFSWIPVPVGSALVSLVFIGFIFSIYLFLRRLKNG